MILSNDKKNEPEATFYSSWIHLCEMLVALEWRAWFSPPSSPLPVALYRSFNAVDAYFSIKCSSCESSTISIAT